MTARARVIGLALAIAASATGCASSPFDKIELGMTEADVIARLGPTPHSHTMADGYVSRVWIFSWKEGPRGLLFDPCGRLMAIAGPGDQQRAQPSCEDPRR